MTDKPILDGHPEGTRVSVPMEHIVACREVLIERARQRQMITLGDLYDRLASGIPGLPERRLPDTVTSDWLVWMYGVLQLVCDDCLQRDEPLLPAIVTTESGEVW